MSLDGVSTLIRLFSTLLRVSFHMFVLLGQFIIYTREAGLGRLSVSMEGPTRCDINMQDLGDGTCEVTYSCAEPGTCYHKIRLRGDINHFT